MNQNLHYKIQPVYYTAEGLLKIRSEYEELQKERVEAVTDLSKARSMGDLSENGYYKAARARLSSIDTRLRYLKDQLLRAKVITVGRSDFVDLGSSVTIQLSGSEKKFMIVGDKEANPLEGKLSIRSPLGKALVGKKKNQEFSFLSPRGKVEGVITDFS